tara:strand:- start:1108 stop:1371 length:264 start_codon:yes stop_codon:yes gene_type:complete
MGGLLFFDLDFSFFCPPKKRNKKSSSFEFFFPPNFINPKLSRVISNHRLELPGFPKDLFHFPKTKIQGTISKLASVFDSKFLIGQHC